MATLQKSMTDIVNPLYRSPILGDLPTISAVHVAGIDDWAWRKGSNYGTIVVDLEHRVMVDVLADCSAAIAANWFKDHPDVEVVSRDRAGLYAEAAREGAPQAKQVADRFHLLQNRAMLEFG